MNEFILSDCTEFNIWFDHNPKFPYIGKRGMLVLFEYLVLEIYQIQISKLCMPDLQWRSPSIPLYISWYYLHQGKRKCGTLTSLGTHKNHSDFIVGGLWTIHLQYFLEVGWWRGRILLWDMFLHSSLCRNVEETKLSFLYSVPWYLT